MANTATSTGAPAPYASDPRNSRGRLFAEPADASRTVFQRDRDRIVHATAFRRMMHKTQVFVHHEGDHYRTRLTHSLEVSQIARSICRALDLNEDLGEALALAHDLGHPPFGHAGEDALNEAMAPFGGFDHNAQSLRVLTYLEQRYADFDGLNLTWECLEGVVKHNGPLIGPDHAGPAQPVPGIVTDYIARHDLEIATHAGIEAQAAALADDVAYNNHDIEDGLRADLFTIAEVAEVPLVGPVVAEVSGRYPALARDRLIHECRRRLIGAMIRDILAETRARLAQARPATVAEIRALDRPMVAFSKGMAAHERELKAFLFAHMYRHPRVNRMADRARRVVGDLFSIYVAGPDRLPDQWRRKAEHLDAAAGARVICDFIAGMTDNFALAEHQRHCGEETK